MVILKLDMKSLAKLRSSWINLLRKYNVGESIADQQFCTISNTYSSGNRFYHNLNHIGDMLALIELQKDKLSSYHATLFATWFHDIIYDTKRNDNEEKSAEFAKSKLDELKIPGKVTERVVNLILSTKNHFAEDRDLDARIFLDADLAILGAPENEYREYMQAIRSEYSWMPEPEYRSARKKVLEGFLNRKKIYLTKEMAEKFERQAILNLEREIQILSEFSGF